jgi:chromatin segregation and condensation protein Rec8/ScpA/Scc1 (kleisin family)
VTYIVENLKVVSRMCVSDLFGGMTSRQEIVCTFLAVLELIKLNKIACVQDDHFSAIMVEPREPDPDPEPSLSPEEAEEPHPEFELDDEAGSDEFEDERL